ncbi:MAG: 3-hydroxyacyl-[acyl-carrier-protein] dehydratase FabZ [Rhodospirillaceae bacterium]|jgi:3-hydroxyacyl-[acyl-carrier-protein] dehydratase|uniref:3-hydroxyacyl-ACP dehydratase FabZ n=1 Tax=unclassified Hwanghaeella TaxID=2605944 RepID=UPI000C6012EB|nr:3-hydroxyacyl-[acyl-carrier-protein] dehydratase FabZ [Rhodospirillaceae bacterium]MAO91420.1 3-hydroxyacyl-[acyl-carrier-protein] dehydratase FabZ [Rhodospirillales bacterium]MAX48906.1 3-hydroxyacyl-[acyl-carrier-protein] dehydratase FabZ [Rhodospirillaceae bacterium]MAX61428.1 3-hydroxyacyl-[acyl-carrier-protein] dehydratase FabZ [Rhodospirillaceae bacterium]MBB59057.1 3-hydroxyacyl-[acyl-carrier-protein] dehydratase FabZ [Rhodospirillaceae bacterium]|tara:strand:- start:13501 stop:13968 length:468 start_codon:yes stop_codon:yes gene_type:complete
MDDIKTDYLDDIDVLKVMERIPHRYPFLMIDRIDNVVPYESAVGIKCVSIGEPHFQGHFPGKPVMPGVLIIESMAQTAGVMVVTSLGPESEGKLVYFMSIEEAKFRRPVVPGDRMEVHVVKKQNRGQVWKFRGEARVDGKVVAEATFSAMIRDKP